MGRAFVDEKILKEIDVLFAKAEIACKKVETPFGEGVVIPAINELRYCGRHLLNACLNDSDEDLRKARNHCQRAIYDAAEAAALISIEAFIRFKERFDDIQIANIINNYQEICKSFEELQKKLQNSSGADGVKLAAYEEMQSAADLAMEHLLLIDGMEEELKKAQLDARRSERERQRDYRLKMTGIIFTGLAVIVGILKLL